jgi:hypothetical protein
MSTVPSQHLVEQGNEFRVVPADSPNSNESQAEFRRKLQGELKRREAAKNAVSSQHAESGPAPPTKAV